MISCSTIFSPRFLTRFPKSLKYHPTKGALPKCFSIRSPPPFTIPPTLPGMPNLLRKNPAVFLRAKEGNHLSFSASFVETPLICEAIFREIINQALRKI